MKKSDITSMNKEEMISKLKELQLKLGKLQFERMSKTLKKSHELKSVRRDIARIQTALNI